jgi:hypothetical protein
MTLRHAPRRAPYGLAQSAPIRLARHCMRLAFAGWPRAGTIRSLCFDRRHLPVAQPGDNGRVKGSDEESRVIVQYLEEGNKVAGDVDAGAPLPLPITLPDGLHAVGVNGEPYRVLVTAGRAVGRGRNVRPCA